MPRCALRAAFWRRRRTCRIYAAARRAQRACAAGEQKQNRWIIEQNFHKSFIAHLPSCLPPPHHFTFCMPPFHLYATHDVTSLHTLLRIADFLTRRAHRLCARIASRTAVRRDAFRLCVVRASSCARARPTSRAGALPTALFAISNAPAACLPLSTRGLPSIIATAYVLHYLLYRITLPPFLTLYYSCPLFHFSCPLLFFCLPIFMPSSLPACLPPLFPLHTPA